MAPFSAADTIAAGPKSAPSLQRAVPWLFLTPGLALLSLTVLLPAAMALVLSFTSSGLDVDAPLRFIGLANLRRLFSDPMMARVTLTTFLYLFGVVPPIVVGSLALAVLVNRRLPGIHVFRGAFYTPVLVSLVVASIAFRWLYAENGLINGWLGALLGSAFTPIGFLTSPLLALPSVMVVTLWKGLGYYMVMPYVFLVAVISALGATKVFDEVFLMTQGGPADSTRTLVYYVYDQAFGELEISYACTVGLALFLIVLALSLLRSALAGGERGLG